MKLTKKSLLYDISNLAYTIADTGEHDRHTLHRVRDICQDGNIDRVSRVLCLAYSNLLSVLLPVLSAPRLDINKDLSVVPHDYEFCFRSDRSLRFRLTLEWKLKIKETAREYMVCLVLADWLAITLPEAADVWKFRAEAAFASLRSHVSEITSSSFSGAFTRKYSPI